MTGIRHMAPGLRALLAVLVAMALIIAPMPVAEAAPCEGHVGQLDEHGDHHHQPAFEQSSLTVIFQSQSEPEHETADSKKCCGTMCSVQIVLVSEAITAVLERLTANARLEWGDQAGDNVAFPPILGPPRFPV